MYSRTQVGCSLLFLACPLLCSLRHLAFPSPVQNNGSINSHETPITWIRWYLFQLSVQLKDKGTRVYPTTSHMHIDKVTPPRLDIPRMQYLYQGNAFLAPNTHQGQPRPCAICFVSLVQGVYGKTHLAKFAFIASLYHSLRALAT